MVALALAMTLSGLCFLSLILFPVLAHRMDFLGPGFVSSANDHVKLCYIGRVPTNWWPHRVLCALWTRRPIVKVAMGCHTEPAAVPVAHVLQKLHFFQFFNFF